MRPSLHRIFEHALKLFIASCPLIIGCVGPAETHDAGTTVDAGDAGDTDAGAFDAGIVRDAGVQVDLTPFGAIGCSGNYAPGGYDLAEITPATPVDYLEHRRHANKLTGLPFAVTSSVGTRCAQAADAGGCEADFAALASPGAAYFTYFEPPQYSYYALAFTRGDAIGLIDSPTSLPGFLAPISSSVEAAMVAFSHELWVECGKSNAGAWRVLDGGIIEVVGTRGYACSGNTRRQYLMRLGPDGTVLADDQTAVLAFGDNSVCGRRPAGFRRGVTSATTVLQQHFLHSAQLEAASITAFRQLERELALHGAPLRLRRLARSARGDEVRHTRTMVQLARAHGAQFVAPRIAPQALRPLVDVARENLIEGCVRETFGALVAHRQARHAANPTVATAMREIAVDETKHAELSWQVDAWAQRRLNRRQRRELRAQRREAIETLRRESTAAVPPTLQRDVGLPSADEAVALVDHLDQHLWNQS